MRNGEAVELIEHDGKRAGCDVAVGADSEAWSAVKRFLGAVGAQPGKATTMTDTETKVNGNDLPASRQAAVEQGLALFHETAAERDALARTGEANAKRCSPLIRWRLRRKMRRRQTWKAALTP